jgi:hypothetical protein
MAGGRSHPFHEGNELRWRILTTGVVRFLGSKPLIESLRLTKWIDGRALLEVPRRGRVVAHDTSLLFTTMSVVPSRTGKFPNPIFFGTHKLQEVTIPSRLPLKNCGLSWVSLSAGVAAAAQQSPCGVASTIRTSFVYESTPVADYQSMDLVSETGETAPLCYFPNHAVHEDM